MANKTTIVRGPDGTPLPILLIDNGDGTYSIGMSSAGGASDPVTVAGPLGRAADAASVSTALSTEDVALLGALLAVFPTTLDTNSGNKSASTLRVVLATDQPALTNAQPVSLQPTTTGGSSVYRNINLSTTGQVVKNAAGQLYSYYIYNNATAVRYLKIYDKATAPDQNDTPVMTYPIPAGSAANVAFPNGVAFANGISVRATTGVGDSDTGAPSSNDVITNLNYK